MAITTNNSTSVNPVDEHRAVLMFLFKSGSLVSATGG